MNSTKKLIAGITLGVMVMGAAVFASHPAEAYRGEHRMGGHNGGGMMCNYADMTDAQKADFKMRHEQMMEWRKKDIQADVTSGRITQKEADARIVLMQEHYQAMQDGKMTRRGGYGNRYADMTDAQKADYKMRHEQMMEWHKKDLQAAVAAGKITQSQADERINRMHTRYQDMQNGKVGMHNGYGNHKYKGDRHNNDNCPYYK